MPLVSSVWQDLLKNCPDQTRIKLNKQIDRDPISRSFRNIERECTDIKLSDDQLKLAVIFWQNLVEILVFIRNYHSSEIDFQFLIKEEIEDKDNILLGLGFISLGGGRWCCRNKPDLDTIGKYVWICCILEHVYDIRQTQIKNQQECGEKNQMKKNEGSHQNIYNKTQLLRAKIPTKCKYCDSAVVGGICNICDTNYNKIGSQSNTKKMDSVDCYGTQVISNKGNDIDVKINHKETIDTWICDRCNFENEGFEICKMCDFKRTENEIKVKQEINITNQHNVDSNREIEKDNVENGSACDNNIDTWECGECKHENNGGHKCEVCHSLDEMRKNKSGSIFTWKCRDCNEDIKEDICPLCGKEGPKLTNWICESCGLYNEILAKNCRVCGRKNDNIKLCSGCENVYIHNSNSFCNKCSNKRYADGFGMSIKNKFTCDKCDKMYLFGSNNSCYQCLDKIKELNFLGNGSSYNDGNIFN